MIDPENAVFTEISSTLRDIYGIGKIFVSGEYVDVPKSFPCVTITQSDNRIIQSRRDLRNIENAVVLLYDVNVYSNYTKGKKNEAKQIQKVIDDCFNRMGFQRVTMQQMANLADGTIFRLFSRYQGVDEMRIENEDEVHWIFGVH